MGIFPILNDGCKGSQLVGVVRTSQTAIVANEGLIGINVKTLVTTRLLLFWVVATQIFFGIFTPI